MLTARVPSGSDSDNRVPPRLIRGVTLAGFIGLIFGIVGVSLAHDSLPFRPNGEVKAAMGIFIGVFVIMVLMTVWLALQLRFTAKSWQKKLFLGSILSWPFLLVRLVYSSMGDFTDNGRFAVLTGNNTIYLVMDVLQEIIAVGLCVAFGISAAVGKDRLKAVVGEEVAQPMVG